MIARTTCMLVLIALSTALAAQSVTSVTPPRNDIDAQQTTNITAGFSTAMNTPGANEFRVRSNLRGWLGGNFSGGGTSSLTFNPTNDLLPGEEIEVVLTTGLQSTGSAALTAAHTWRFRADATAGPGVFTIAQHATGCAWGYDLGFGDLDNDGDLDAVAIDNGQSYILTNDGNGAFSGAALSATNYGSYKCALADFDNDGDLDIVVVNSPMVVSGGSTYSGQNIIFINNGSGGFTSTINLGNGAEYSNDVDVGDIDGDGDVDIVVANGAVSDEANDIYVNDGNGSFTRRPFLYVAGSTTEVLDITWGIRLADFDGDGHLDVFLANFGFGPVQSWVYLNDGAGNYYWMSRVDLGAAAIATSVTTGDFNGDGHLDVAHAHLGQPAASPPTYDRVTLMFNNGSGGIGSTTVFNAADIPWSVEPVDVDADGDLDLFVGMDSNTAYIMINNGSGQFIATISLGTPGVAAAFADVDGDGDLDAGTPDKICINGSNAPVITVTANGTNVSNGGTVNVNYNTTLAALSLQIGVDDANSDNVGVGSLITNIPTQGIQGSEFSSSATTAPYTLQPTSGTFNQGSVTHQITLTADDGTETTVFSFSIVVGAAPNNPPAITVTSNGSPVGNSGTLNAAYGTSIASLVLAINVTDPENNNVSLAGTVSNTSGTGILNSEFSSAAQPTGYTLNPSSGSFTNASTTHVINLTANDGNGGTAAFSFSITVGAAPTPEIQVYESNLGGTQVSHGASASGGRDFGSQLVSAGATGTLTVVIFNNGNAALDVNSVALSGTDATHFVLNTGTTSGTVAANGYTQFTLAFDPSSAGSKTATVEIDHNDSSVSNPFTFEIAGVGTTPAPVPLIVVKRGGTTIANGGTVDFGSFTVGSTPAPITITIENAGNANLTLGTPSIAGTDAGRFTIIMNGFNGDVAPSSSTSFHVEYDALVEGPHSAVLSFTHDDTTTANPFSINLAGTTTAATNSGSGSGSGSGSSGGGCVAGTGTHTALLIALLTIAALAATRTRRRTS